jgi:glycerol uptake facilitator-like aquaporin
MSMSSEATVGRVGQTRVSTRQGRRLVAEFTGTGLLVTVVVGSGIAATRLTGDGEWHPLAICAVMPE